MEDKPFSIISRDKIRAEALAILKTIDGQRFNEIRDAYIDDIHRMFYRYLDLPVAIRVALSDYERLGEVQAGLSILDLGTGGGYFPYICKHYGHTAIGIDDEDNEAYRQIALLLGIDKRIVEVKPFVSLPSFGMKFDVITAFAITFSKDWSSGEWEFFLDDLFRNQLKSTGKIIFTLNHVFRDQKIMDAFDNFGAIINGNRILIEKYLNKKKVSYWDWDGCHLCKSTNSKAITKDGNLWYRCLDCWTVYQKKVFPRGHAYLNKEQASRASNKYFVDRIKADILSLGSDGLSVIDVGCGSGWLSEILKNEGKYNRIVALDLPNRDIVPIEGVEDKSVDMEIDGVPEDLKGKFDLVVNWQVIEHIKRPDLWFGLMAELLKPKGRIFCTYCPENYAKIFSRAEWRYSSLKAMEIISNKHFEMLDAKPLSVLMEKK